MSSALPPPSPRLGRAPWPKPGELDAARRSVYDLIVGGPRASGPQAFSLTDESGRLLGPFNSMLIAPEIGVTLQELGSRLRYRTGMTDRCREIAILVVAQRRRSEFEWYAHERIGRRCGLTEAELDSLRQGAAAPDTFSWPERAVHEAVVELLAERDLTESTFGTVVKEIGEDVLQELLTLVGYYDLLALVMRVWRTPLPADVDPVFDAPGWD